MFEGLKLQLFSVQPVQTLIIRFTKFTEQTGNKNSKKSKFKDVAGFLSEGAGNLKKWYP